MEEFCGSQFWDWDLTWYTDGQPVLTPCFEHTVFTAIPCLFLWIFSIFDLYSSYSLNSKQTGRSLLIIAKVASTTALIALEIGMVVESQIVSPMSDTAYWSYPAVFYVPSVRVATFIISMVLLLYSKRQGVRSSGVQFIFWLLVAILQAIRFRTVILQAQEENKGSKIDRLSSRDPVIYILEIIYLPVVLVQFVLHCWADDAISKHSYDLNRTSNKKASPEPGSSFLSRILFEWFTPLVWKGYRKPLESSDLYNLIQEISSESAVPTFDRHWPNNLNIGHDASYSNGFTNAGFIVSTDNIKEEAATCQINMKKTRPKLNGNLFPTLVKAFGFQYFRGFLLWFMPDLMVFVSPLILDLLIDFVDSNEPTWKGIFYASVLFLNAILSTTLATNGNHKFFQTTVKMRGALVSAVYRKSLLLSNSARRDESSGEIVNHMAVDTQHVTDFINQAYILFSTPVIISIALYFLSNILGIAALAGLAVICLILPVNVFVASRIQKLQLEQMTLKDKRTKLTNEILNGIKCIKLYAWEPSFEDKVMTIRKDELRVLKITAYWNALSNLLWTCAPFLIAIGSFGTFVLIDSNNVLDAQTAFVCLSLFNIMSNPLKYLPIFIPNFIRASVAIKRLNKYLNADEINLSNITHDSTAANPISIKDGSFSWDEKENRRGTGVTLQDINLEVMDGQLVAIVGKIGAGKSSLLSVFLNELVKIRGQVNIRGTVAYVAQQAWIQNATVRDNILFERPYDPVFYNRVVEACALIPDLENLPGGDQTEIGDKGINLSGGQKQRVALARAIYNDADIYFFDDILSAVDAHVGAHIFSKVLGPKGLLSQKTRLLVTHGILYLPFMDNILVMTNGRITEAGTYRSLISKNGTFSGYIKQHITSNLEEDGEPENHRDSSDTESASDTDTVKIEETSLGLINRKKYSDPEPKINKLIEKESTQTKSVKASVYLEYFGAAGWALVIATFVMYLIFQGFSVGGNIWLSRWTSSPINQILSNNDTSNIRSNYFYLSIYGTLGLLQAISILVASIIIATGTLKSSNVLHLEMLKGILRAPIQFFEVTPLGRIINRFSKDVDTLDNVLPMSLRVLVSGIFEALAVLAVISVTIPLFLTVILPVGILYVLIQRFFIPTSRQISRLESITKSPIFSHFGETVAGVSTIRAFGQQKRFILESERRHDENMKGYYSILVSHRWLEIRLEAVGNSLVFFAALFTVLGRDTLDAGMVGLSISYALQITSALIMLVNFTSDVETHIVCVERIKEYSDCPQEAPWSVSIGKPDSDWPQNGKIVFDNYEARYRPGLELVLRNVSCEIKAGQKVGIIGRTGAGKSSVTLGLFRIVEAAGGKIEVDGHAISRLGLHDVRGRITIIPQEPMLFSGSLKLNLDPFEEKTDRELWMALELAHLKSFVDELPGGLSYEITEGGENFSVGQRQIVCLARALLRGSKVIILDEATSAVDLDTEELILKTIRSEFKDSTVITIAHRLNTIMDSDRVIVLEKGEIREFDTPENLLSNNNTIFARMAKEAGVSSNAAKGSSTFKDEQRL